jgi:hypothetical protein
MRLVEINWQPSDRQLRQFGGICLVALPAIAWLWGASVNAVGMLAILGALLAATGMLFPATLKPVFVGLMLVALPIGLVVGELAMLLIYFAVFLPFGLAFRVARRDALQRRINREQETYWQPKKRASNAAAYYRQS